MQIVDNQVLREQQDQRIRLQSKHTQTSFFSFSGHEIRLSVSELRKVEDRRNVRKMFFDGLLSGETSPSETEKSSSFCP